MFADETQCVECGWTYLDAAAEDSAEDPREIKAELDEWPERPTPLQWLARLKHPVLWLLLGPPLAYFLFAALDVAAEILDALCSALSAP